MIVDFKNGLKTGVIFWLFFSFGLPALAYSEKDASFVTNSKNLEVLKYIICLERGMKGLADNANIENSLSVAAKRCSAQASKIPENSETPNAEDIKSMILECGFRKEDSSPDAGCNG
jgi:hypothetical protein